MTQSALSKKILGIDPGLLNTGWGIIESNGNNISYIASGHISTDKKLPLSQRLMQINQGLAAVLDFYQLDEAALEETFVNKNALSSLKLGHARGAAMMTISLAGLNVSEYSATRVKKSITGVGRAEKEQMMMMIKVLLPASNVKIHDEADALAVAICHANYASLGG